MSEVGLGALTLVTGRCCGGRLARAASISSKADWIVFVSSADSCLAIAYPAGGTRVGGMGSARRGLSIVDAGSESSLNELMGSVVCLLVGRHAAGAAGIVQSWVQCI